MKPVDVKSNTYIASSKEINDEDHKFKIGDIVRISKYIDIFVNDYVPYWSEEDFVIKKVKFIKKLVSLVILKAKKLFEHFP